MANPALATLHDIHLPAPIGWWPLANGWYLLIMLCIVLLALGLTCVYRYYRRQQPKRHALQLLAHYEQQYQQQPNPSLTSAHISELLKRVALVYFPRCDVAGLTGESWLRFLNQTATNIDFNTVRQALLELPYQIDTADIQLTPLFICARAWIKQRRTPCSN